MEKMVEMGLINLLALIPNIALNKNNLGFCSEILEDLGMN